MLRRAAATLGSLFQTQPTVAHQELERVASLQKRLILYLERLRDADEGCHCGSISCGSNSCPASAAAGAASAAAGAASDGPPKLSFRLQLRQSGIPGAGRGVFLEASSKVEAGDIITLYPGLAQDVNDIVAALASSAPDDAFAPAPPVFTVDNSYLLSLSCLHKSLVIDGQPHGLSAQRFLAAAADDPGAAVNTSWLLSPGVLPDPCTAGSIPFQAALGNMINHSAADTADVMYDMCPLPPLPGSLLRFVPCLTAGGTEPGIMRWVPLLLARKALRVEPGGTPFELFADYGVNDPAAIGYHV